MNESHISNKPIKFFSNDEDMIILKLAGYCGFDRVAQMFDRTPEQIKSRYQFLKAKSRKEVKR